MASGGLCSHYNCALPRDVDSGSDWRRLCLVALVKEESLQVDVSWPPQQCSFTWYKALSSELPGCAW